MIRWCSEFFFLVIAIIMLVGKSLLRFYQDFVKQAAADMIRFCGKLLLAVLIIIALVCLSVFIVGSIFLEKWNTFMDRNWGVQKRLQISKKRREWQMQTLERLLYQQLPILGNGLRTYAARQLVQNGSAKAILVFINLITRHEDRQRIEAAIVALRQLENPDGIDEVCRTWAETRHSTLAELIVERGWTAKTPVSIKVLCALKTGQIERLAGDDAEILEPLLSACNDADNTIRQNAKTYLRQVHNVQVIERLLQSCQSHDTGIRQCAERCVKQLHQQEAQEAVCQYIIDHDDPVVLKLVKTTNYAPRDVEQRALFFFLTAQWEKYEVLDFDGSLLKTVYPGLEPRSRTRLAACARRSGRTEWVDVVIGTRQQKQLLKMTDDDWEATLSLLTTRRAWREMWHVAQRAPALWSVRLMNTLHDVQWRPKLEIERTVFEQVSQLAQQCQQPQNEGGNRSVSQLVRLEGNAAPLSCFALRPDGRLLAGSNLLDNTIRFWQMPEGRLIESLEFSTNESRSIIGSQGLTFSPDGQLLAIGGWQDRRIRIVSLPEGTLEYTIDTPTRIIRGIAFSPDWQLLAYSDSGGKVRICHLLGGKEMQTWQTPKSNVQCLVMNTNDHILAGSCCDETIWLMMRQLSHRRTRGIQKCNISGVTLLTISPNGKRIASVSCDGEMRVSSLSDKWGGRIFDEPASNISHIGHLAFTYDGRLLAGGNGRSRVRMWNLDVNRLSRRPVELLTQNDLAWIQHTLYQGDILPIDRLWLEFMQELFFCYRRYDIELGEVPKHIPVGKWDIELGESHQK